MQQKISLNFHTPIVANLYKPMMSLEATFWAHASSTYPHPLRSSCRSVCYVEFSEHGHSQNEPVVYKAPVLQTVRLRSSDLTCTVKVQLKNASNDNISSNSTSPQVGLRLLASRPRHGLGRSWSERLKDGTLKEVHVQEGGLSPTSTEHSQQKCKKSVMPTERTHAHAQDEPLRAGASRSCWTNQRTQPVPVRCVNCLNNRQ